MKRKLSILLVLVMALCLFVTGITMAAGSAIPRPKVKAAATAKGVSVTWSALSNVTGYRVYRKTAGGSFTLVTTAAATTKSYVDTGAVSGAENIYCVRGIRKEGTSIVSGEKSANVSAAYVKTPAVTLKQISSGMSLTWGSVGGAEKYQVFRSLNGGSFIHVKTVISPRYTDKNMAAGDTVSYKVRAVGTVNGVTVRGSCSAVKTAKSLSAPAVTVSAVASGVTVKWNKVAGADGYRVYRKNAEGVYARIAEVTGGSTLSYTDTAAVKSGTKYAYKVAACCTADGKTSLSAYSSAAYTYFMAKPTLTSAKAVAAGIKLTWEKDAGASGYRIYRSFNGGAYTRVKTIDSAATVAWTDANQTKCGKYSYKIAAYKTVSSKNYVSLCSSVRTVYKALTPANLKCVMEEDYIKVTWNAVPGAAGYILYRSTDGKTYTRLCETTSTSKADKSISLSAKAYYYKAAAYYTAGGKQYISPLSAPVSRSISGPVGKYVPADGVGRMELYSGCYIYLGGVEIFVDNGEFIIDYMDSYKHGMGAVSDIPLNTWITYERYYKDSSEPVKLYYTGDTLDLRLYGETVHFIRIPAGKDFSDYWNGEEC